MGCQQSLITMFDDDDETTENENPLGPSGPQQDFIPNRATRRQEVNAYLTKFREEEKAMSRKELGTFRDIQKRRIVNEIIRAHAGTNGEAFVLVLDKLSTFLLSTQVSMNDIMYPKEAVCLVENVMKKRQPNPFMEAVYFIQPTASSIKAMVADFEKETGKAQYGGVHIVLAGKCPEAGMQLIKETPRLVRHMITFAELNIDVFPTESHLINFGLPQAINQLFGHGKEDPSNETTMKQYMLIAERMVSVCSSLHELPHVRIRTNNSRSNLFYNCFSDKMQKFIQGNPEWKWHDGAINACNGIDQRATLIVLDRRDDLSTVLRHDFSYQSLAHDTFEKDIKAGLGQTSFEYNAVHGTKEINMSLSDMDDPIWVQFRHQNINTVPPKLNDWFNTFRQTEAYKLLESVQRNDHPKQARKIMTLMRTKDATQKVLNVYTQHTTVVDLLIKDMKERNGKKMLLLEIAELESQLITGYAVDDGNIRDVSMNKIREKLKDLLSAAEVPTSDKLRLILLWFVVFGGSTTRDAANKIFASCEPRLPSTMESIVPQLSWLNVAINSSSQSKEQKKMLSVERARIHKRAYQLEKENVTVIRCMESKLKDILQRHIDGTLDSVKEYAWYDPVGVNTPVEFQDANGNAPPWYGQDSSTSVTINSNKSKGHSRGKSLGPSSRVSGGASLRKHKLGGTKQSSLKFGGGGLNLTGIAQSSPERNRDESKSKESSESIERPLKGGRIILLMLGGGTFAEMKDAYQMMKSTGREILVCTTGMLTPIMFTDALRRMARNDDSDDEEVMALIMQGDGHEE